MKECMQHDFLEKSICWLQFFPANRRRATEPQANGHTVWEFWQIAAIVFACVPTTAGVVCSRETAGWPITQHSYGGRPNGRKAYTIQYVDRKKLPVIVVGLVLYEAFQRKGIIFFSHKSSLFQ